MRSVAFETDAGKTVQETINCLAGVQDNNRRAKEERKSLFFEHLSLHNRFNVEPFHSFPRLRFQLESDSQEHPCETDKQFQTEQF